MSQTDFDVANASGATVRADINAHLDAMVTLSSGSSAPATTFPNQWWYDTSANELNRRNNANTAWLNNDILEAGTVMLFHQTAAPTGWTKDTAATLDEALATG